jgi:hypothetical protein
MISSRDKMSILIVVSITVTLTQNSLNADGQYIVYVVPSL